MATSNINKIVRGNLNFKPWIAARNPKDIVNSYVQKFYKQIPDNFKNDLMKLRMDIPKTENRVPLRAVKVAPQKFTIPIISNKPNSKLRSNGYRSPAITAKNSFVTAPKKLLKTPNFKIYTKRRYASSVSSSKSGFQRNKSNYEEYRKKIYKPALGMQFQTFRGTGALPSRTYYENSVPTKNIIPTRLFNEIYSLTKNTETSKAICHDLMAVNDVLKKKICLAKPKAPAVEPFEIPKIDLLDLSLKGWNHPSKDHYTKLTSIPVVKKPERVTRSSLKSGLSSFGLMPVKRKPYGAKITNPGHTPRKANAKNQMYTSNPYGASTSSARRKGFKMDMDPPKVKSEQRTYTTRDALDFVCMSRAERSLRSRNQYGLAEASRRYF